MSKQLIALAVTAIAIIVVGTLYQAKYSERWVQLTSEQLDQFTACVERLPRVLGDWTGKDDPPITEDIWKRTHCTAYVSRTYENSKTGKLVSVYLVSGAAKHITIHSPDWCYVGAGFELDGEIENYVVRLPSGSGMQDPEFATAVFQKNKDVSPVGLRIFWTYSYDGIWKGPTNSNWAKAAYGGRPAMYKIYLVAEPVPPAESPCVEFVKELFPMINDLLFSNESGPSAPDGEKASSTDLEL